MSVTFVTPNEIGYMRTIERLTKKKMLPLRPPSDSQALEGQLALAHKTIEKLLQNDLTKYSKDAEELLDSYSAIDLVSALLKDLSKDASDIKVTITPEKQHSHGGGHSHHFKRDFSKGRDRNDRHSRRGNFSHHRSDHDRHDSFKVRRRKFKD